MNPSLLFQIANPLAAGAWIVLILFPRWKYIRVLTVTVMSSLVFAGLYAFALGQGLEGPGDFRTLEGVALLFQNPYALLAGWVHYLAFDLFVGNWISANALKHGISRWIVLPAQILTFLFGPVGLLTYTAIRTLARVPLSSDPFD